MRNDVTFQEALVDTIRYYGEDTSRRSLCFFIHEDGRRCAIGRFIRPEHDAFFHHMDFMHNSNIEAVVHEHQKRTAERGRTITENEAIHELVRIKDASLSDLIFLEILHDEDANWSSDGLTGFGEETVKHFRPDIVEEVLNTAHDRAEA